MATIRDVAEYAGLSVGTVSRILNGSGYASAEARRRVAEAVSALDYTPNGYARGMHANHSRLIAMVLHSVEFPYFTKLLQTVQRVCLELDYKLLVRAAGRDPEEERRHYKSLLALRAEGILLCGESAALNVYARGSLPVVRIGQLDPAALACVAGDDRQGGRLAAEALLDGGCRCPALYDYSDPKDPESASPRADSFRETCRSRGVEPVTLPIPPDFLDSLETCRSRLEAMLAARPEIDGVFTMMDSAAIATVCALQRMGRRVPEEIQVVGYDGIDSGVYAGITTLVQPVEEIGRRAVELLLGRLRGEELPHDVLLPVTLMKRESTRG